MGILKFFDIFKNSHFLKTNSSLEIPNIFNWKYA